MALGLTSSSCTTMGLIGDICSTEYGESMRTMTGCKYYNPMCDSQVFTYCNCTGIFPGVPTECNSTLSINLLPTLTAQQRVLYICNAVQNAHPSCAKCTSTSTMAVAKPCQTDPLDVLSDLCTSYTSNVNCTEWNTWCSSNTGALMDSYCKRVSTTSTTQSTTQTTTMGSTQTTMAGNPSIPTSGAAHILGRKPRNDRVQIATLAVMVLVSSFQLTLLPGHCQLT